MNRGLMKGRNPVGLTSKLVAMGVALSVAAAPVLAAPANAVPVRVPAAASAVAPAWASFSPKTVNAAVPTKSRYILSTKQTIVLSAKTVKVTAKSNGTRVYVKRNGVWRLAPYRYVKSSNTLRYEESLRLKFGLTRDPLGGIKPTYVTGTGSTDGSSWTPEKPPTDDPYWNPNDPTGGSTGGGDTPTVQPTMGSTSPDPTADNMLGGGWRSDMLNSVNGVRAAAGLPPLQMCSNLNAAAQGWSAWMAANATASHTAPNGTGPGNRMASQGYVGQGYGENVAAGYGSVPSVMGGWVGSPGHYANLTNPQFTHVGFGAAVGSNGMPYYTQDFGLGGNCT